MSYKAAPVGPPHATFDSSYKDSGVTLSGGNLVYTAPAYQGICLATVAGGGGKSTGKWYWEITITGSAGNATSIGVSSGLTISNTATWFGANSNEYAYYSTSGGWWSAGSISFNA